MLNSGAGRGGEGSGGGKAGGEGVGEGNGGEGGSSEGSSSEGGGGEGSDGEGGDGDGEGGGGAGGGGTDQDAKHEPTGAQSEATRRLFKPVSFSSSTTVHARSRAGSLWIVHARCEIALAC